jgi:hypothetical protein
VLLGPRTPASAKGAQLALIRTSGLPYPSTIALHAVQESTLAPSERTRKARALTVAGVSGLLKGPRPALPVAPGTGPAHPLRQVRPFASPVARGPTPSSQWHPLIQPVQSARLELHPVQLVLEVGPRVKRAFQGNTRPMRGHRLAPPVPRALLHRFDDK